MSKPPISRRCFLATLALASRAGGADKPPVIDTHMHVWADDPRRFPFAHPYDKAFKPPRLAATVGMRLKEMDTSAVSHCVLVQVIYHGWDNLYVAHCLKAHPKRFRGQGLIDPTDPKAAEKLELWVKKHSLSGMRFSPIYYP